MITYKKPPLGVMPRHFWLRQRITDCIEALQRLQEADDWNLYLVKSKSLADEIKYAVTEWEKYYDESKQKTNV